MSNTSEFWFQIATHFFNKAIPLSKSYTFNILGLENKK